ncbi:MAG TPA: hypothetical protein VEH58_00735 [Dehalococcoidales bacterium]|nr:hypothetical protein [Dehalococcoidales bacterium]
MDASIWILIAIIAAALLLLSLLRPRGGPSKYPEVAQAILWDVKINRIIAENFLQYPKVKTFETNNWRLNRSRIRFLSESQQKLLQETFKNIEEDNRLIKAAKKAKSDSYKNIDLSALKANLDKCILELENWLQTNIGTKELPPKYPTISGMFFGDR